jgi:hypothetical protein
VVDELTHGLAERLMDTAIQSTITNTKIWTPHASRAPHFVGAKLKSPPCGEI